MGSTPNTNAAGTKVLNDSQSTTQITSAFDLDGELDVSGAVIFSGIETIAAGGTTTAADLTKSTISVDADAGGDIVTVAAGTEGQIMTFVCVSATGVLTVTPVALAGGTSVTMNAAGETLILQYVGATWYIMGGNAHTII